MADASPPYFWTNVLDFPARVQLDDDRAIAELGNPPLHVLLSMTGLNRGSFRLAGCGDRVWTLTTRS
jgi:hypothetical protein